MLMRWSLERANAEEVEVYLEASLEGKLVYEYFGFREVEWLIVFEGRFVGCMMVSRLKGVVAGSDV